ncbi:MAG: DciA family protein [Acidimicrobiia bacterium]
MSRVLKDLGLEERLSGWRAVQAWDQLVGPRIARHSRALTFRDGILHVEVEGSAWMHELRFLGRDLVRKINNHLGAERVREVRFVMPRGRSLR